MQKCQYILGQNLPPAAAETQIRHVQRACEMDKARLGQSARSHLAYRWRVHESVLRRAILDHISSGKRIFLKRTQDGTRKILANHLQANITLQEDLDVYVEMVLMQNEFIILNAHEHDEGMPRLPQ